MFPVAILAGGLATRMRPLTDRIPKALIEVAGEPFISHQLKLLRKNNIRNIVLCVGYLGEMIRDFIGDGSALDMQISYAFDGPELLGTGGAIKNAAPLLGEEFFVLYGDSYLDCDYLAVQEAFKKSGLPALMTVFKNKNKWDRSNILYVEGRIERYDKKEFHAEMEHIDYGLSVFKRSVFDRLTEGKNYDLEAVFCDLISRGRLAGFEVKERFYEIGSAEGLEEIKRYLSHGKITDIILDGGKDQ